MILPLIIECLAESASDCLARGDRGAVPRLAHQRCGRSDRTRTHTHPTAYVYIDHNLNTYQNQHTGANRHPRPDEYANADHDLYANADTHSQLQCAGGEFATGVQWGRFTDHHEQHQRCVSGDHRTGELLPGTSWKASPWVHGTTRWVHCPQTSTSICIPGEGQQSWMLTRTSTSPARRRISTTTWGLISRRWVRTISGLDFNRSFTSYYVYYHARDFQVTLNYSVGPITCPAIIGHRIVWSDRGSRSAATQSDHAAFLHPCYCQRSGWHDRAGAIRGLGQHRDQYSGLDQ